MGCSAYFSHILESRHFDHFISGLLLPKICNHGDDVVNSRNQFLTLLRFNLRLLPPYFVPLIGIFCINACMNGVLDIVFRAKPEVWEASGIATSLSAMPIMFSGILAMQFFTRNTGWSGAGSAWLMPAGEFLLTRPVPRRTAHLSLMCLYFVVLLSPCLLNVGVTLAEPHLRISLYHSKTQSTEGADKLSLYQKQFPNSSVIHLPKAGHNTLVIPFGEMLIAFWQLWMTVVLALALQTTTLLVLPSKVQMGLLMAICLAPMFLITFKLWGDPTMALEKLFFVFAHHWVLIALLTLGVFVLVQRMAAKRIQSLEIM